MTGNNSCHVALFLLPNWKFAYESHQHLQLYLQYIDCSNICNSIPGGWGIPCSSEALVKMFLCKCFAFDKHQKSLRKASCAQQGLIVFKNSLQLFLQIIFICQLFVAFPVYTQLDWSLEKLFTGVVLDVSFGGWAVSQDHGFQKASAVLSGIQDF